MGAFAGFGSFRKELVRSADSSLVIYFLHAQSQLQPLSVELKSAEHSSLRALAVMKLVALRRAQGGTLKSSTVNEIDASIF